MLSFTMMNAIFTAPVTMDNPHFKEDVSRKLIFMETPSQDKRIRDEASRNNEPYSEVLRRAVAQYYTPKFDATTGTDSFRAPAISSIPCGPWGEAFEEHGWFTVSRDVADEMELIDGDVWTRSDGPSMLGAGIPDNARVAVRPYADGKAARTREIVIVQVEMEDGTYMGTIKRFMGNDELGRKRFIDGDDNPFPLPENCKRVEMPAKVLGALGLVS